MNQKSKIPYTLAIILLCMWLGTTSYQVLIGLSVFDSIDELVKLDKYSYWYDAFVNYLQVVSLSFPIYVCTFIFMMIFILMNIRRLKKNGWIFIITFLFLLFSFFELFFQFKDFSLYNRLGLLCDLDSDWFKNYFNSKFGNNYYKMFLSMSFLSHIAIAFFMILKPLDKNES